MSRPPLLDQGGELLASNVGQQSLAKEGWPGAEGAGGAVQSRAASLQISAKRTDLIRYLRRWSTAPTAPSAQSPRLCEGGEFCATDQSETYAPSGLFVY